ncbi:MAG: DeoR family transcriptional regulator [Caulobacter sp.]|nr:DeoR family transcriptional regulator [Caulobacter sp.]
MPQTALKTPDFLAAANTESSIDQKRLVARLGARWFLQGLTLVKTFGGGDILDGLILLAVTDANTRHLNGPDGRYQSSSDIPPNDARRPVSVYVVARELGVSYETARRHVQRLIKAGKIERVEDGVVVPDAVFAEYEIQGLTAKNYSNTRRFLDQLRDVGVI